MMLYRIVTSGKDDLGRPKTQRHGSTIPVTDLDQVERAFAEYKDEEGNPAQGSFIVEHNGIVIARYIILKGKVFWKGILKSGKWEEKRGEI